MTIVIDIPEEEYKLVKSGNKSYRTELELMNAVAKGVLLPKGHGSLKDVDAIHKEIEKLQNGMSKQGEQVHISRDQYKGLCYARGIINEAQTIIEADGEVQDDNKRSHRP